MGKGRPASVEPVLICLGDCKAKAVTSFVAMVDSDQKPIHDDEGNVIKVYQLKDGTCGKAQCVRYIKKTKTSDFYKAVNAELIKTDEMGNSPYLSRSKYINAVDVLVKKQKLAVQAEANKFQAHHTPPPTDAAIMLAEANLAAAAELQEQVNTTESYKALQKKRVEALLKGDTSTEKKRKQAGNADDEPETSPPPRRQRKSAPPPEDEEEGEEGEEMEDGY